MYMYKWKLQISNNYVFNDFLCSYFSEELLISKVYKSNI